MTTAGRDQKSAFPGRRMRRARRVSECGGRISPTRRHWDSWGRRRPGRRPSHRCPAYPCITRIPLRALRLLRPVWPAGHRGTRSRTTRPTASGTHETLGHAGASALRMREVREPAAYAPAMGLFRSAMGLFRGRAGKDREQAAAELPNEQARTVKAQPVVAREVKREARPDPDKPGWGRAIG